MLNERGTGGQGVNLLSVGAVRVWRRQLIQSVLRVLAALGFLALIAGSYTSYARGVEWTVPVYVGAYALLVLVAFWRQAPYVLQVGSLLFLLYGMGVFSLVASGLAGDGGIFLLAMAAMTVLLLGWRWGIFALVLCVVTVATVGGFFSSALLFVPTEKLAGTNTAWSSWISTALVFLMLGALLVLCQNYMFRRLVAALAESQQLTSRLEAEVVERSRTEEALRASEERFRTLVESMDDVIFTLDRQQRHTGVFGRWVERAGLTPEAFLGKTSREILGPDAAAIHEPANARALAGEHVVYEWSAEGAEGREYYQTSLSPIRDTSGAVIGIVGVGRDITALRRVEDDLRRARQEWEGIFQAIGHPTLILNPRHEIIAANRAAAEAVGVSAEELYGRQCFDVFHSGGNPPSCCPLDDLLASNRLQTAEMEMEALGGTYLVSCTPVCDGEGHLEKVIHIATDMTERKRAEAEVLRLQHLLQNITDSMPSALVTLALDGRVLTWNPAAEALTGQDADQVKGQLLWQVCPELTRYRDLFEQVVHERQIAHRHREQLTAQTGIVYRDVDVFPLVTNNVEGVVLRIDDVTRRVQIEEMMLQSAKMASVGGLAAGVAHEINNPLGAMMQSAQVLQMALDVNRLRVRERLQTHVVDPDGLGHYLQEHGLLEYLQGIRDMGARAAKIVTDLLSFSRRQSSDVAPHNLNNLVERTLDLAAADYDLRKKYDFREIEIVREMALDLPRVLCDGQQVQQVVLNLVRNAAQAMAEKAEREGPYRPCLTLRTEYREGWVRLEVEDNGPGIPEAVRERLFEPFFTTKGVGEGTGLGLWLCWSIVVERHKGRMWVESGEDTGARFVVELPVAQFTGLVEEK